MKLNTLRIILFLILALSLPDTVTAQWWNLYGPGNLNTAIETANGDLVAGGASRNLITGMTEGLVLRTDADGNELWRIGLPTAPFNSYTIRITETNDEDILVAYQQYLTTTTNLITIYKIDGDGTVIWESPVEEINGYQLECLAEHPQTEKIVIGAGHYYDFDDFSSDSLFAKLIVLSESGTVEFQTEYRQFSLPISNFFVPVVAPVTDGYLVGLGEFLYYLDHSLAEIWSQPANGYEPKELIETQDGYFVCASYNAYHNNGSRTQLFKFDLNGTVIWNTSFDIIPGNFIKLIEKPDQQINVIYNHFEDFQGPTLFGNQKTLRRTLSVAGELSPEELLPTTIQNASSVTGTSNNDLIFMGRADAFPANIPSGYLLRTDCEVSGFNNILSGRTYVDENFNCQYDSTEQLLSNYPIQIVHNTGLSYYTNSDSLGVYSVDVSSGSYQISLIPQSPYEIPCTPQIINFNISDTSVLADLPVQHIIECPQMTVSIGTPFLRRCFENTYQVRYCNSGTADAEDSYLEIELDSFTVYESSSLPPTTQNGSLLTFDLGDIESGNCESFTITTTLSCDAELGQNHCVSAHIYPDSICLTNSPDWDGSSIQVSAQCEEDSVRFFINNLGLGDMLNPLDYIVIQDEILFIENEFQLNSGQSIQRAYPANGSTYRMEAEQSAGHPGNSMPSATVEGCGEWPFATGFFGYFPQDDNDPFADFDCQSNIGSFDPNDKTAFPVGYGEQNIIEPNTILDYKIRFQNTGTDTAFNVSIRDDLSDLLDISTLRMGAASHPYNWRLENEGTLVVDFPDILLPDSTTNLEGSNGFISFKIGLKSDIPDFFYFSLSNKAAIYFDFNDPIVTNTVRHRLDTNFVEIILSTEDISRVENRIDISPNPARDITTLTFPEDSKLPLTFHLYDHDGRLVSTKIINQKTAELNLTKLSAGIYYYGVFDGHRLWASGKLVVL